MAETSYTRLFPLMVEIQQVVINSLFEFNDTETRQCIDAEVSRILESYCGTQPGDRFVIKLSPEIYQAIAENENTMVPENDYSEDTSIDSYRVVCDGSNNTEGVVANGEFVLDVWLKPSPESNYIRWSFKACKTTIDEDDLNGC